MVTIRSGMVPGLHSTQSRRTVLDLSSSQAGTRLSREGDVLLDLIGSGLLEPESERYRLGHM